MSEKNSNAVFVAGVLLGSMLGGLAALLAAPRSGKDTREILKKTAQALPELAEDLTTMVQLRADQLSESSRRNWDDTLKRLQEAIAAGVEASQLQTPSANVDDSNPQS